MMFAKLSEKVIVSVLSVLTIGAIYTTWDALKSSTSNFIIPTKAIMAFDLKECPAGWGTYREMNGRFALGADDPENVGNTGGQESVILEIPHMPNHDHSFTGDPIKLSGIGPALKEGSVSQGDIIPSDYDYAITGSISKVGQGKPHENMPPYLTLLYCVRI